MRIGLKATVLALVLLTDAQLQAQGTGLARAPQPISNPGEWIKSSDYPADALRDGAEGQVGFMLRIDREGHVSRCTVTRGSGTPSLDQETCRLISARALFKPAIDPRGHVMESNYASRVSWVMPGKSSPLPMPTPGSLLISFTVLPDGSVDNCTAEVRGMAAPPGADPCIGAKQQRFMPARDSKGTPEARRLTFETTIKAETVAVPSK